MDTNEAGAAESSGESGNEADDAGDEIDAAQCGGGGNNDLDAAAMVADAPPPVPDAAPPPAGMLYMVGTPSPDEEPERLAHEGRHKILVRTPKGRLQLLPQGAPLLYNEWATVPRPVFTATPLPEGYEVQVHRGGKRWRYRTSPTAPWQESRGKGTLMSDGRRVFQVLDNNILAAVLVCSAFWGERPPGSGKRRYEAGHAHAVAPGVEPREAAHQLSWLTKAQNAADKRHSGGGAKTGLHQAIWARPADDAPTEVVEAWKALALTRVLRDGRIWAQFGSQTAAATTLGIGRSNIPAVLRGTYAHAGNYMFDWVAVAEPAERDRVQVNAKRGTFVTRAGQLLQRKTRLGGRPPVWTAFTLTPGPLGYVSVETAYAPLPGRPQLHRLVFRAFANDRIETKIEIARTRNAEIDNELRNLALSALEHADLEREKNGLAYKDFEINHINGIKTDNRLVNLEILTTLEHNVKTHGTLVVETTGPARDSTARAAFVTITTAARSAGVSRSSMSRSLTSGNGYAQISDGVGTTRHFHKG